MTIDVTTWTPAVPFGRACQTPILDMRPLVKDRVLENMDVYIGRWEDGTTMKVLLQESYDIETSESDCAPSEASYELTECTVVLPDQRLISIGFSELPYRDTMRKFCTPLGLTRFPTLFNRDGSFNEGNPLADRFIVYILGALRRVFMKGVRQYAMTGSQAIRHQVEGIMTQIANGPMTDGAGCELYDFAKLDWNALVGGTGTASPASATITAENDTINLLGYTFTGMEGMNAGDLIVAWLERMMDYDLVDYMMEDGRVAFDLWHPRGQRKCLAELFACMQPCGGCVDPMSDQGIRARSEEFRKTGIVWAFPYDNIRIRMLETPALTDTYVLRPTTVEGRPTAAIVFRDLQDEQDILEGELPWFGTQAGLPDTTPLHMADEIEAGQFQERAFQLHLTRNGNCISAFINTEFAIPIFAPQTWLVLQNMTCGGSLVPTINYSMSVPVTAESCAAVEGEAQQLQMTVPGLETLGIANGTANAGSTFAVYFLDGITQLIGTVVSYNTTTDALILSFSIELDCDTADGPNTVKLLQVVEAP